jgi:3-deoxy-D-manno-octulosonate 8-phosphate phosphatase (KDO 8-P phosphatase)
MVLTEFVENNHLEWNELLFMGDDIPDMEVMKKVGVACCPADAVQEIKDISAYISPLNGGYGCGRDIIEKVMKLRNHWNEDTHVPST